MGETAKMTVARLQRKKRSGEKTTLVRRENWAGHSV